MKKIILIGFVLLGIATVKSQAQNVGINNTDPKAALDVNGGFRLQSENTSVTGPSVLLTSNRSHHVLIGSPVADFNIAFIGATENGQHAIITNSTLRKGFLVPIYIQPNSTVELIYSNGAWKLIGSTEPVSSTAWGLTGNAGTDTSVNFIGTTDNVPLVFKANNNRYGLLDFENRNITFGTAAYSKPRIINPAGNVAIGEDALQEDTTGSFNTAIGNSSMINTKSAGGQNTAIGSFTLKNNLGNQNTALGSNAMEFHQNGNYNTAVGAYAYSNKFNGIGNTAIGYFSMAPIIGRNNYGNYNTAIGMFSLRESKGSGAVAIGYQASFSDTAAEGIVAIGRAALYKSINRQGNIAIGDSAMFNNGINAISNADGSRNTAIGNHALFANKTGYSNTSVGNYSMFTNETGTANTAIGSGAFAFNVSGGSNTVVGETALYQNTIGFQNTALGTQSLYQNIAGNQNVAVGGNSLYNNKNGNGAVAIGYAALFRDSAATGTVAIGRAALYNNNGREGNLAIGDSALYNNGSGIVSDPIQAINNIAIGKKALLANRTGGGNISVGNKSLISNVGGYYNIAIGNGALASCRFDNRNIAIGENAMQYACNTLPIGSSITRNNIAIGESALSGKDGVPNTQQLNVAIGDYAMQRNTSGQSNVAIGINSLDYLESGFSNTAIGAYALRSNVSNNNIVAIGRNAGYLSTSSNKLFIESVETPPSIFPGTTEGSTALIFGDFAADSLLLNAKTVVRNNAVVRGYTKLGGYDADVPSVKMKKISIPAGPAVNGVQSYPLGSGITDGKVVGIQVLMNYAGSWKIPPSYIDAAGYEYNVQVQNNNIVIVLKNGNSANIGGKPISVIVTYEE